MNSLEAIQLNAEQLNFSVSQQAILRSSKRLSRNYFAGQTFSQTTTSCGNFSLTNLCSSVSRKLQARGSNFTLARKIVTLESLEGSARDVVCPDVFWLSSGK